MTTYPECEKWAKVHDAAVAITGFWDWHFAQDDATFYNMPLQEQLYLYFEIDSKKLEEERRAMLEALQNGN